VAYLLADGVHVRANSAAVRSLLRSRTCALALSRSALARAYTLAPLTPNLPRGQLPVRHAVDPLSGEDTAFSPEDEASDGEDAALPRFPALEAAITAAIARLGGAVLPKLNWSSPKARAEHAKRRHVFICGC
jgi:hypothetical protein